MMSLSNLSIRTKLTLVIMLASMLIHLCVSSVYIAVEVYSSRNFLERETATLASSLGANSKDLLLKGKFVAADGVLASLTQQPNIRAAYLFNKAGLPVADYLSQSEPQFALETLAADFSSQNQTFWTTSTTLQLLESWKHIGLFLPISHDGLRIGTIYLLSDLDDLYGRLSGIFFMALLSLVFLLLSSFYLAGKLQGPVSIPILKLVDTMSSISRKKDYSIRAQKEGQDEIGLLVDGFNHMLDQIEQHRQQLVEHQESLEQTVELRTLELREMVVVLEEAKKQAISASEAKSNFLANITHELRTPLIGVIGINDLLLRSTLNSQQQMLVSTVQKSGDELLALINNILDFSKIEAGELNLEAAEFFLSQTVEDVLGLLMGSAAEKGLTLYSDIPLAAACKICADEGRVRQMLMNLVGNAIKFTETGDVTVKVSRDNEQPGVANFTIEIIDTGIGMDATAQQRIFSAFYQADGTNTREHSGTGLGLAIVQQLVGLFAGSIELESSVGVGSCFRINLPLPVVAEAEYTLPETLLQETALVYVADKRCQQLLCSRLTELGLAIEPATSAADAWYRFSSAERSGTAFKLGFLSTDSVLPDGQLLYQAVRGDGYRFLRVILLLLRNQFVDINKQESKLYLPLSWSTLHQTLCCSWQELHLVDKRPPVARSQPVEGATDTRPRLLLAGGSFASRELINIALQNMAINTDLAESPAELDKKLSTNVYSAVLLELSSQPFEPLQIDPVLLKSVPPLYILHSGSTSLGPMAEFAQGSLEKPFTKERLRRLLKSVIEATAGTQTSSGDSLEGVRS